MSEGMQGREVMVCKRGGLHKKCERVGDAIWTEPSVRSVLGKSSNMKVLEMRERENEPRIAN